MKRSLLFPFFICCGASAYAELTEKMPASSDGYGPVAIGMAPAAAANVAGMKLVATGEKVSDHCHYAEFEGLSGVNVLIEKEKIAAFTIYNPAIRAAEIVGIGNTPDEVKAAYPKKWHARKNEYGDDEDIVVKISDKYGYVFFFDEGKVHYFNAGDFKAVQYVEGCA